MNRNMLKTRYEIRAENCFPPVRRIAHADAPVALYHATADLSGRGFESAPVSTGEVLNGQDSSRQPRTTPAVTVRKPNRLTGLHGITPQRGPKFWDTAAVCMVLITLWLVVAAWMGGGK